MFQLPMLQSWWNTNHTWVPEGFNLLPFDCGVTCLSIMDKIGCDRFKCILFLPLCSLFPKITVGVLGFLVQFQKFVFTFFFWILRLHHITPSNMEFTMLTPEISNPNTKPEKVMLSRDLTALLNLTVPSELLTTPLTTTTDSTLLFPSKFTFFLNFLDVFHLWTKDYLHVVLSLIIVLISQKIDLGPWGIPCHFTDVRQNILETTIFRVLSGLERLSTQPQSSKST